MIDLILAAAACYFIYDYYHRRKKIEQLTKELQAYKDRTHSEYTYREEKLMVTMRSITSRLDALHKKEEELKYIRIELGEKEQDIMRRFAMLNQLEKEYQKGGDASQRMCRTP